MNVGHRLLNSGEDEEKMKYWIQYQEKKSWKSRNFKILFRSISTSQEKSTKQMRPMDTCVLMTARISFFLKKKSKIMRVYYAKNNFMSNLSSIYICILIANEDTESN